MSWTRAVCVYAVSQGVNMGVTCLNTIPTTGGVMMWGVLARHRGHNILVYEGEDECISRYLFRSLLIINSYCLIVSCLCPSSSQSNS